MSNQFDGGIGRTAREQFTPGQPTPDSGFQNFGMHMAMVVDDIDEAKMGRVWVYIPGVSARNNNIEYARYSTTREPAGQDGTPGKPIMSKRSGFIQAYPLTPHSGSDRLREKPNQSDGRNPNEGQSNSYGDFAQARNGDQLMVMFAGGDPGRCFVIGHIPKTGETDMIPGHKPEQTDASGSGVSTNTGPAYELPEGQKQTKPASVFFNNLTDAGLIGDPLRGCSTSYSTRESPSRVRGIKSPGDPDTAMTGHQLIMDDHPDNQLMRLRTSKGMQVLLSDSGDFLYMSTATGKCWFEIDDGGHMHVFAKSSVSFHTQEDFNFVCDRDFNLQVNGNANWIIKGDTRIRMNKGGNITVGEGGGDLDITTINNFHVKTQKEIRMGAQKGITAKSADFLSMQSAKDMTMKSAEAMNTSAKSTSLKSSEGMLVQTGQAIGMKAGTSMSMKAAGGNLNHDASSKIQATNGSLSVDDAKTVNDAQDPNQADIPLEHSVAGPPNTSGPPKSPGNMIKSAAVILPQPEPWLGHRGKPPSGQAMNPSSIPKLTT